MTQSKPEPLKPETEVHSDSVVERSGLLDQVFDATVEERYKSLKNFFHKAEEEVESLLPPQMKGQAGRLCQRALMTFSSQPSLNDPHKGVGIKDFARCVIQAAEVGLAIDGKLAHVVPYKGKWQLQIDYKGFVAIAKRSGQLVDIYGDVVCEKDEYEAWREDNTTHLKHRRPKLGTERGKVIGAYSVLILPGGLWRHEEMDVQDLERIRSRSASYSGKYGPSGPWVTDTFEMFKKTVFKRALKLYCDDPAVVRAFELDEMEHRYGREEEQPTAPPAGRQSFRRQPEPPDVENSQQESRSP